MTEAEQNTENNMRLVHIGAFAAEQHVVLKPVVEDRTTMAAEVSGRVPFHDVCNDLLTAALLLCIGVLAKSGQPNAKLLGIREVRKALDDLITDLDVAEVVEPFCTTFAECVAQLAAQEASGVRGAPGSVTSNARVELDPAMVAGAAADAAAGAG